MPWQANDPSFVTAVERLYLADARRRVAHRRLAPQDAHRASLAAALYAADPTNGGLRFRNLDRNVRSELEERLLRYAVRSTLNTHTGAGCV